MYATLARAEIIAWLERDRLDASRKGSRAHEHIDVRCPYRTLDDRIVTRVTNQIAQHRYAVEAKSSKRIGNTWYRKERAKDPRSDTAHPPYGLGWAVAWRGLRPFGDDEIRASLEPLDQLGQMFRLVREVRLQDDHRVTARIARATGNLAA
jgi:hypothetical protein